MSVSTQQEQNNFNSKAWLFQSSQSSSSLLHQFSVKGKICAIIHCLNNASLHLAPMNLYTFYGRPQTQQRNEKEKRIIWQADNFILFLFILPSIHILDSALYKAFWLWRAAIIDPSANSCFAKCQNPLKKQELLIYMLWRRFISPF